MHPRYALLPSTSRTSRNRMSLLMQRLKCRRLVSFFHFLLPPFLPFTSFSLLPTVCNSEVTKRHVMNPCTALSLFNIMFVFIWKFQWWFHAIFKCSFSGKFICFATAYSSGIFFAMASWTVIVAWPLTKNGIGFN